MHRNENSAHRSGRHVLAEENSAHRSHDDSASEVTAPIAFGTVVYFRDVDSSWWQPRYVMHVRGHRQGDYVREVRAWSRVGVARLVNRYHTARDAFGPGARHYSPAA